MNSPKILVAAPTYSGMAYCHDKFTERLRGLSYDNYDILLVDNSPTREFFKKINKTPGIDVIYLPIVGISNMKKVVRCRNKILNYAIENSYDYVLMMDSDVIPPTDIIERLLAHNKDIVSGIYFNVFMVDKVKKICPVAWKGFTDEEFEEIKHKFSSKYVNSKDDLRRYLTPEEVNGGELQEVIIPSCGCLLLSRNAFKKLKYGLLDVPSGFTTTDDIYFSRKAREAGFKLYCDPSLQCEHLVSGKFRVENGEMIHPVHE